MSEETEKSELEFKASVIDGTALSIHDYIVARNIVDWNITRFLMHEFYRLLCISVQTTDEAEFHAHIDKILASRTNQN